MSYTRVNWQDAPSVSTPLSASNLNKMDAGIKQNADDIETLQQHTYDSALDDTSTNAPQTKAVKKAIEDAVESVTIITDPTLSNEGQAADAKATGEAVARVKSQLVDQGSAVNFTPYANLYNTSALVTGYYINPANGKIAVAPNEYFAYSKTYIPVTPGTTLRSTARMFIAYYDGQYNILSALQMDSTKKTVVPNGAVYARFSCSSPNHTAEVIQVLNPGNTNGLNPDKYDYRFFLDGADVDPDALGVKQKISLLNYRQGKNLYNSYDLIYGYYLHPTEGVPTQSVATAAYSPTYIPVTPGDTLVATDRMFIVYYDKYYNIVSALQMDSTKKTVVPTGVTYARFSCVALDHSAISVQIGTTLDENAGRYSFHLDGLQISENNRIIVDVNGNGDYTSFTEAVYNTVDSGIDLYVMPGTYDIVAEYVALFGQTVVDGLADNTSGINNFQYGIRIHDRTVNFAPGAHLVCDWTGHTVDAKHRFCAFRIEPNTKLNGLDLDCTATFYAIHDDYGTTDNSPFTVDYQNCRVVGHSLFNANCIGGGCHKYSRHTLKNCYFQNNVNSSDLVLSADVRYHNTNTADAEPEVHVSNCFFSNNFNAAYYGAQTTKMKVYVSGCYAPKGINKVRESSSMTTDNVELYAWSNTTNL